MRGCWIPVLLALSVVLAAPAAVQAADSPLSSYDLVQQARDAGELRPGRAALLGLQALAAPGRVPKTYRGHGDVDPAEVMADVAAALPRMSAAERRAVKPYLLPPILRQSAWLPARLRARGARRSAGAAAADGCAKFGPVATGAWKGVHAGPTATVYYPADRHGYRASAVRYAHELSTKVLPTLTRLFRKPLATITSGCDELGGDELQYYVVAPTVIRDSTDGRALAVTPALSKESHGCDATASFVLLPPGADRSVVAHETMHAVQFAYPRCESRAALIEGGAVLAEDLVYPGTPSKRAYAASITTPFVGLLDSSGTNAYDAWAFWYALGRPAGVAPAARSAVMKRILEGLGQPGATLASVVAAIVPGGWRGAFSAYALQRWNQDPVGVSRSPVKESFKVWDRWTATPGGVAKTDVALGGKPQFQTSYKTSTREPLSTWFQDLAINDPKVRRVAVTIPGETDLVQAFLQLADGTWRVEDWSGRGEVRLCRDRADENVTRIVVATTNASPTGAGLGAAEYTVTARDRCGVPPVYRGTISRITSQGLTINGTVEFRLRKGLLTDAGGFWTYDLASGSAQWSMDFAFDPTCPITGSGTADLTKAAQKVLTLEDVTSPDFMRAPIRPSPEPRPWYYSSLLEFDGASDPTATMTCQGDAPRPYALPYDVLRIGTMNWDVPTPPQPLQKAADPSTLAGTVTETFAGGVVVTSTWNLVGAES